MKSISKKYCILGAGPAGLGAAWELANHNEKDIIVVDMNKTFGGLARTEKFGDSLFDVGPHRFFSKNQEIKQLWHYVLGSDFRPVTRLTRVFYKNKFFLYPINFKDVILKMGPVAAFHALISYLYAQTRKNADAVETFEDWVVANFGKKLYRTFFKTYTEKVWGIPCKHIGSDWAAQRIKGLDLTKLVKNSLGFGLDNSPKTLADEFDYPTKGAGMMYDRMAEKLYDKGVQFLTQTRVNSIDRQDDRLISVLAISPKNNAVLIQADHFISSIPITHFIAMLNPPLENSVANACKALYYRDHVTVNLEIDNANLFPDQWIYVHSPDVKLARIANYRNFSSEMTSRNGVTPISVEYFTFQHEDIWQMDDNDLIEFSIAELQMMGLLSEKPAQQGWVVRETETYPTYYLGYDQHLKVIRNKMNVLSNFTSIGRGGMYKYNNMDHSLYTGLLAGRNLINHGRQQYDIWKMNIEAEYHESAKRA